MKLLLLLLAIIATVSCGSFSLPTKSTPSLRAKLIREGRYQDYLVQQHAARLQQLNTGSQSLLDYSDEYYLGNITIGTPAQSFLLVMDTGSANVWIVDTACTSQSCNGSPNSVHTRSKFDPTKSSTYVGETRTFLIDYGSGNVSGHLAKDTIGMVGFTITNQEFGVAESVGSVIGGMPIDGTFGMGWPSLAVDGVTPPMQNLLPQLDLPIFTMFLDRNTKGSNGGNEGLITYGALDTVNCDSTINYVPLAAKKYWQFAVDGFSVGDVSRTQSLMGMTDSGNAFIGAPNQVISDIVKATGAQFDWTFEIYTVPCSTMQTQPDLVFTIGGLKYPLKSAEYVMDLGLGNGKCALTIFGFSGLSGAFGPVYILGQNFLRHYCSVYDYGNEKVGFALAIHSS